ncbi:sigma 54-interacting transcriptional regulator [Desulfosporosinus sp.]|uniref:sigma 54-interacting transcriptional regulator n=1 Tax=Desulfosporosinus sp. TaxID=157907 RepID=UPI002314F32D|nr:sigma 54-interacting transcriptional regulator [Desulfosporosinus sp.]MCO5385015.1 sigma 54-interacting transcriptional regulator [Desulfosporosinus sp.]MDA8222375.1 sigma 54-interacting transcriptional regulator [Desulfitobacterium hafniense]
MKSQTLSLLMDQNVSVIQANQSLREALEKAITHHLVIKAETQLIGVLTIEQAGILTPTNQLLNELHWVPPLIIEPEMDTLVFCLEHLNDLRPVVIMSANGELLGVVTPSLLVKSLFGSWNTLNTFFNTLLDTVNEAVAVVTQEGIVSHWNSNAQTMYSIPEHSIIGKPISDFFERTALATLAILDEGRPIRQAYHRPRPETHVQINASPVIVEGKIVGAISTEQDITQVVRLNEELSYASSQLLDLKQKTAPSNDPFGRIIGKGPSIRHTISIARKVANSEATILITGESGVGKELFAQAIHKDSLRASKPFIAVNCGAIPMALFESELFGYTGGAFTGAERKGKPGKLELANGGTLFLDEIGELPTQLQVKLLRVLQDKCFYRVGGTEPLTVDTRIVAATNRNLDKMIKSGEFREDLYYRLNVIALEIPPLRTRTEDIPDLIQTFLQEFTIKYNKPIPTLDPEIMLNFLRYDWPGNIRELRNVIERLAILAEGTILNAQYLPSNLSPFNSGIPSSTTPLTSEIMRRNLRTGENSGEVKHIAFTLKKTNGNKTAAAKLLGISRGTLYYKLKQYGLA